MRGEGPHGSIGFRQPLNDSIQRTGASAYVTLCIITGAGKSSLLTLLFRIAEVSAGSILLDGVDISTIGLQQLRRAMAAIPQEPLLLSGTLGQYFQRLFRCYCFLKAAYFKLVQHAAFYPYLIALTTDQ